MIAKEYGMHIRHQGHAPQVHPTAYVAPTATLVGDVRIGPRARVMYGAALDAEGSRIEIGEASVICENAVLRASAVAGEQPVLLGDHVYGSCCRPVCRSPRRGTFPSSAAPRIDLAGARCVGPLRPCARNLAEGDGHRLGVGSDPRVDSWRPGVPHPARGGHPEPSSASLVLGVEAAHTCATRVFRCH
ncbi:gamma carbonic anhydrase family protein [Streptomyces sp. NPDC057557]|uniref:gamma carbonic anhydrase family protein n=1 Tax=Streptomyces sp. NPDC057557 TaxID=3346167 RepID=UPI003687C5FE